MIRGLLRLLDQVPLGVFFVVALTLGLAPFFPEPHVWQKLKMLFAGELSRPIDIFDLFLHGTPWLLLVLKLFRRTVGDHGIDG